ncbi:MAG: ATP-binding protein, partial [Oscillospiraceae bacterium]
NHDDLKFIGNFGSEQYYLMSYKNNDFMEKINSAMSDINANDPSFENDLYIKYYGNTTSEKTFHFTREETEFIKNCPILRVGISSEMEPMAYDKNNKFTGITVDILNKVSQISGLKFEYFKLPPKEQKYEYDLFRTNKISLISGVEVNKYNLDIDGLVLTKPYFSSQKSLVARNGELITTDGKHKIAIVGGSGTLPLVIKSHFPNFQIITYTSIDKCLDAVADRRADVLLYNQYLLDKHLSRPQYENLSIVPGIAIKEDVALSPVVYLDGKGDESKLLSDPLLVSILNKSIQSLDQSDVEKIIVEHTIAQVKPISFSDVVFKYRVPISGIVFMIVVCISLLIFIVINRQKNYAKMQKKNMQLAEAVAQAEHANSAKSQFLSRVSHEIRTPMNAIVGITAIAKQHIDEKDRIDAYLDKINSSSKVLLNIINDVLDMSAIESAKLKIAHTSFDLKSVLTSISNMYYAQCREKNISFEMVTSDIINEVLIGDELRVNQILLNLISNAYKFTPNGGKIKVTVSQSITSDDTAYFKFTIEDNGIGMTQELQERLFKPFEQESVKTAQKHGGSGLGLSITKNLVDMMHGAITVQSEKEKGSIFTVELPFEIEKNRPSVDKKELSLLKAIIIDDDNTTKEYTCTILEKMGIDYTVVNSGEMAIDILSDSFQKGNGCNICFIDWKTSGINGI